jgi:N-acetylmuramoyl-L-alanine amidase
MLCRVRISERFGRWRGAATGITAGLVVAVVMGSALPASAKRSPVVVVDAGHGAYDRGAQSGSVMEKHLALDTARRLERFLEKRGVRVVMTRERDRFVPLPGRVAVANRIRNAVFVSVHYNWSSNRSANGVETYYYTARSARLAGYVHSHMLYKMRPSNRGIKRNDFHVIRNCRHPAVLVEAGFLSNSWERQRCLDPAYRQRLAEAIGEGILRYHGGS